MTQSSQYFMRGAVAAGTVALVLALVPCVQAAPLYGTSFGGVGGAILYAVNPGSGAASNPRPISIDFLVGIEVGASGVIYGLSNSAADVPNALFTINPATGAAQLVGPTGLAGVAEGDLAFDPISGELYGCYNLLGTGQRQLFTINLGTAVATPRPISLAGDPSGLAFGLDGTLYAIDTNLQQLLTVDKTTGQTLTIKSLSRPLGSTVGMDTDPATGILYVADGESSGTDKLYSLDPGTGTLTEIGPTGLANGLAGLAFLPEPNTLLLLLMALVVKPWRRGNAERN